MLFLRAFTFYFRKINNGEELDSTYGFKNQLSLTANPGLFQVKLSL